MKEDTIVVATQDTPQERRHARLTRDAIAALVRGAIDDGINAYRMTYSVPGYSLEAWTKDIVKRRTGEIESLLTDAIGRVGKHPAWPAMVAVVEATGQPSSYVKDFYYHDRETLERRQPTVFAWTTRATGTWLLAPGTGTDSCLPLATGVANSGEADAWYWWNGYALTGVDAETALRRLKRAESALTRQEKEPMPHVVV